jgi:hypothetical protein
MDERQPARPAVRLREAAIGRRTPAPESSNQTWVSSRKPQRVRVTLPLRRGERVRRLLASAGGLLLLRDGRRLGVEVVVGALDRALDELVLRRSVDDHRPPRLELDQHAGRARLVDIFPNWIADRFAETRA